MDPVNKWLSVVILFMVALLCVIWGSAGVGRYELFVQPSDISSGYSTLFVLDTKNGEVHAKIISEDDLFISEARPKRTASSVFEWSSARRYNPY